MPSAIISSSTAISLGKTISRSCAEQGEAQRNLNLSCDRNFVLTVWRPSWEGYTAFKTMLEKLKDDLYLVRGRDFIYIWR